MQKLIVASGNSHKIAEITELLKDYYTIIPMKEAGITEEIEETGSTFYENAYIKASYIAKKLGCDALADDSGLCVAALSGAPGVYSARYSGDGATDARNNQLLLKNMQGVTNRSAKFVSCIVLCSADGTHIIAEGSVEGEILLQPIGNGGFGYDPLFYCPELKKTFGEATSQEKNSVSHRYRALCELLNKLKNVKV